MPSLRTAVAASPDKVFGTLVDVAGLPRWNDAVVRVLEDPGTLTPGSEWVVEVTAMGKHWPSRSRVEELDRERRVFAYRSRSDDGNPSYAQWRWTVREQPGGSEVEVEWSLNPKTFWRRVLLAKVRAKMLGRTEVPASLASLAAECERVS
jgi:uncharacterized protein YndB with AHSA1/START domain